jgi:aldehyde:ferredoxin oxidoreductase
MFRPLGGTGPTAGVAIDRAEFEAARELYYTQMGWTPEGLPTRTKFAELALDWANEFVPQLA